MATTLSPQLGITTEAVTKYLAALRPDMDTLTQEMYDAGRAAGVPIVQPDVAQLLTLFARMRKPKHVVEFGTAIGFSTIAIARGLEADATLTSFEIDPERHQQATDYLARATEQGIITASVRLVLRDANEAMEQWDGPIDMAFLDAIKEEYGDYLEQSMAHLSVGGLVIVDNALMGGSVAIGSGAGTHWSEESVSAQRTFNDRFVADPRLQGMLLPVGDGVAVALRVA